MSRRGSFWASICSAAALVAACATAVPRPTEGDQARAAARWPDLGPTDLDDGRALYVNRCSGCHALVPPKSRPPMAWPHEVALMSERAGLDDRERELVTRYVVTMSEERPASPAPAE
ncbi:MAG: hypothetical protein KC635_03975 [Myxococcales bacterium]|nr:hypothetical protein [Myxococcales bacterium]MCB9736520.1 hypothetical protein [Deltaproteobacteria bacterium]